MRTLRTCQGTRSCLCGSARVMLLPWKSGSLKSVSSREGSWAMELADINPARTTTVRRLRTKAFPLTRSRRASAEDYRIPRHFARPTCLVGGGERRTGPDHSLFRDMRSAERGFGLEASGTNPRYMSL